MKELPSARQESVKYERRLPSLETLGGKAGIDPRGNQPCLPVILADLLHVSRTANDNQ